MPNVYMAIGIAGSGKSFHFNKELKDYVHLSRDKEGGRTLSLVPKMEAAINSGAETIVLDCTFLTRDKREPFVAAAKRLGADIHAWYFKTTPEHAQFNICWRMCERYGKVLRTREDYAQAKDDPNIFPPMVHFQHNKQLQPPVTEEGFMSIRVFKSEPWALPAEFVNKAIILDYDGTVRETKSGNKYPLEPDDIQVYPVGEMLRELQEDGYVILGASNQSGVAKNTPPMAMAHTLFQHTNKLIGVDIDYDFDYSAAGPVSSWHRKPMPGMGVDFIWKYKLDPSKVVYVGDMTTDKTFAKRCRFNFEWAEDFFEEARTYGVA